MASPMPSLDAIIIAVVLVSCIFVILVLLAWKRSHSPKSFLRRLLRTDTLSFHPSNSPSILPSFEPCKVSPFYASMRRAAASIVRKFGMKEMPGTEFDLVPSTPRCFTPPNPYCSTLGSPQTVFADASDVSSLTDPSPLLVGAYDDDRLPPNITLPIPRETALDRMMHRCRKDAQKGVRTGNRDTSLFAYPQISYPLKETGDTPRIMVTLPSSTSAFPSRPSFVTLLSTGADKDPFFWDSLWLSCTANRRAVSQKHLPSLPLDSDQNHEAPLDPAMRRTRRQGIRVFDHLGVPSGSGKHRSRGYRAPLGDSADASKPRDFPRWF